MPARTEAIVYNDRIVRRNGDEWRVPPVLHWPEIAALRYEFHAKLRKGRCKTGGHKGYPPIELRGYSPHPRT